MKLDFTKAHYEQPFGWVGDPHGETIPKDVNAQLLSNRRADIEILGGCEDPDASYGYDERCVVTLDGQLYLLSTSSCSCPSPNETWTVEMGPSTADEIRAYIKDASYNGYTMPAWAVAGLLACLPQ